MTENTDARTRLAHVLRRIPEDEWHRFLQSKNGHALNVRLQSAREAVKATRLRVPRAGRKPVEELVDLLGDRIFSDRKFGPWVRYSLLLEMGTGVRQQLEREFCRTSGREVVKNFERLRAIDSRARSMATRWRQGSRWSRAFCEALDLPQSLAVGSPRKMPKDQEVLPAEPLPPLHDFQTTTYRQLRNRLVRGKGQCAMLSLPTGAGKTRVAVEAICDHIAENCFGEVAPTVLWIAQSVELQEQAWECFRQVWQVPPRRQDGRTIRRRRPLGLVSLWGGRKVDDVEIPATPGVLIASIDQLASWERRGSSIIEDFHAHDFTCVVLDEAHSALTNEYRRVLVALGIRAAREWRLLSTSPPLIGLTATPWRTSHSESVSLRRFFGRQLIGPAALGNKPIATLQRRKVLSLVKNRRLRITGTPAMTAGQLKKFELFGELPAEYLELLGKEGRRNAVIIKELLKLPKTCRTIVFACSVAHAELLVLALNRINKAPCAALVTAQTPRAERYGIIDRYRRRGSIRFLCNVGVLTLGFDAPQTDVVCVTRPTWSSSKYEQMVGRGLRGPQNGGTERCLVLDVQDVGLPADVQSYERVLSMWDAGAG